jgi:predicted NAD-dependent protein-ADP-ribosyltransferase YbiA (DUF1768 family)
MTVQTVYGVLVQPFKVSSNQPCGSFANTTSIYSQYTVTQSLPSPLSQFLDTITWPSSEHAFHAQKLILFAQTRPELAQHISVLLKNFRDRPVTGMNRTELHPRNDVDGFFKDECTVLGNSFDHYTLCRDIDWHKHHTKDDAMAKIIKLKFSQHLDLLRIAMQIAKRGIMLVEISLHDGHWASGPDHRRQKKDGAGGNVLGILILENANRELLLLGEASGIPDPRSTYQQMQKDDQEQKQPNGILLLSHAHLVRFDDNTPLPAIETAVVPAAMQPQQIQEIRVQLSELQVQHPEFISDMPRELTLNFAPEEIGKGEIRIYLYKGDQTLNRDFLVPLGETNFKLKIPDEIEPGNITIHVNKNGETRYSINGAIGQPLGLATHRDMLTQFKAHREQPRADDSTEINADRQLDTPRAVLR